MRIRLTTAAAVLATLVLAAPAEAGRAPRLPDCATAGKSIAATSTARVYVLRGTAFACRYGVRRRVRLGSDGDCGFRSETVRLTGRYVGWVHTTCNIDESVDLVYVADLIRGRIVGSSAAATGDPATSDRSVTTWVRDLEMGADGTAVFAGVFDAGGDSLRVDSPLDVVQLRVLRPGNAGGSDVVDQGQDIAPRSVALSRFGLYYTKGGSPVFRAEDLSATEREAADGAARQRRCAPRRSRTVAATHIGRVFELPNNELYACRYSRPRRIFVGTTDDCLDDSIGRDHVLVGRFVAYVSQECRLTVDDETVLVHDLGTGERLHATQADGVLVRALALNRRGAVAWIGAAGDQLQVWRADRVTGLNGELVEQGPGIDPTSLAVAGGTFYWLNGPTARSAPLR